MLQIERQAKVTDGSNPNPKALWESSAHNYLRHIHNETDGDGRLIRDQILHPAMLKHLGDVAGKTVLDAGCGDGILGRAIAQQGARVYGGDFTYDFVRAALNETPSIQAVNADVARLPINSGTFDALVSNLVLMWVPNLDSTLSEFSRVLKTGSRAVISVTHPDFNLGQFDLTEPQHPKLVLSEPVNDGIYLKMINRTNGPYPYYQRGYATYINTATKNGFRLVPGSGLEDVYFPDDFIQNHPSYIRHQMFPLFMIMALEKI